MTPTITRRSGVTLIETLVALGLIVGMLVLWQPVLQAASAWQWRDNDAQAVMEFDAMLQKEIATTGTVAVVDGKLQVTTPNAVHVIGLSKNDLVREAGTAGGYMPMLPRVSAITWQQGAGFVRYELVMTGGRRFSGVVVDGSKKW